MKKIAYGILVFALLYLAWHCSIFVANAEYRNRYNDREYMTGQKQIVYYSPSNVFWWVG